MWRKRVWPVAKVGVESSNLFARSKDLDSYMDERTIASTSEDTLH